jgi:V8-like Glu-specific endopeptidase
VIINSIEHLLDFSTEQTPQPDSLVLYGFPSTTIKTDPAERNTEIVQSTFVAGKALTLIDKSSVTFTDHKGIDTLLYVFTPRTQPGQSGSPVFFLYNNPHTINLSKVVFGGLMSRATAGTDNVSYAVKPKKIIELLALEESK